MQYYAMSEATVDILSTTESPKDEDAIGAQFDTLLTTLSSFRTQITQIQQVVRGLEKQVKKEVKGLRRDAQKGRVRGNRKRSGFAQPTKISRELCEFMEKAEGTQYVISYINDHKLQNPQNRKTIKPDDKLRKLLGVSPSDEVTYFNLQKYMNRHFPSGKEKENGIGA